MGDKFSQIITLMINGRREPNEVPNVTEQRRKEMRRQCRRNIFRRAALKMPSSLLRHKVTENESSWNISKIDLRLTANLHFLSDRRRW